MQIIYYRNFNKSNQAGYIGRFTDTNEFSSVKIQIDGPYVFFIPDKHRKMIRDAFYAQSLSCG
jgi:hypothetical protein